MKLTRYNGHVPLFSQNMEGRERTLFGSTVQDDDINNQFTPEFLRGWGSVGSTEFPTLQDFNALAYTHNKLLSYLYQAGIPSYSQNEEYYIGSIVQYNKDIYICLIDNPVVIPTDANAWKRLINISDMSQEVINNDLLTVTSGAVYRALDKKWAIQATTGTGNIARMSEVTEKADTSYVNTELVKKRDKTDVTFDTYLRVQTDHPHSFIQMGDSERAGWLEYDQGVGRFNVQGGRGYGIASKYMVVFPTKSGTIALTSDILGVGQKWHDVTREREPGVTYTNTEVKPIGVFVSFDPLTNNEHFFIDEMSMTPNYDLGYETLSFIIPSGSTYRLGPIGNAVSMKWMELR